MTDFIEEQAMEIEALESIYMEEFSLINESDPVTFSVHLVPNQDGDENHVAVSLQCILPPTYPDVAPEIEVTVEKGLSDGQKNEIVQLINSEVESNIGMAMTYTLCEAVREYLLENNREGNDGSEYQEMMRRMELKDKKYKEEETAELKKLEKENNRDGPRTITGTPVTVESFAIWKKKFDEEMNSVVNVNKSINSKLTGRQLFQSGAIKDEDEDEEDIDEYDGVLLEDVELSDNSESGDEIEMDENKQ